MTKHTISLYNLSGLKFWKAQGPNWDCAFILSATMKISA